MIFCSIRSQTAAPIVADIYFSDMSALEHREWRIGRQVLHLLYEFPSPHGYLLQQTTGKGKTKL